MRIAQLQMAIVPDKAANLRRAGELLRAAAAQGADMAVLPEIFCCPYTKRFFRQCSEAHGGAAQQMLAALAAELGLWIVGGSIPLQVGEKLYNAAFVYDPEGREVACHRKTHLFDIDVAGGQSYRESDTFAPGADVTVFDTPWGKVGLCICFDMRFEELARLMALGGARIMVVPAAFNMTTGPAHWQLLFRQRAVDNQCFTVGVSPARDESARYVAWGHSIVCDPWGGVVHECGAGEELAVTELALEQVEAVRAQLPILAARRTDLYGIEQLP